MKQKRSSRSNGGKLTSTQQKTIPEEKKFSTGPKKTFNKFNKGQRNQKPVWTTSLVQRPADPAPVEKIVRDNFTGLTDEDLFGPAFLFEEPEMFVEKKILSTIQSKEDMDIPEKARIAIKVYCENIFTNLKFT